MTKAKFKTLDSVEVEIDGKDVTSMSPGTNDASTRVVTKDEDFVILGTELEIAAALGFNPLDVVAPEDDDASIEELVEEGDEVLKPVDTQHVLDEVKEQEAASDDEKSDEADESADEAKADETEDEAPAKKPAAKKTK